MNAGEGGSKQYTTRLVIIISYLNNIMAFYGFTCVEYLLVKCVNRQ